MTETHLEIIRLEFNDQRQVLVSPKDEDRFFTTCEKAAWSCQMGDKILRFHERYKEILTCVRQWIDRNTDQVASCYSAFQDHQLMFFFVPKVGRYDFDLSDKLADLDIDLVTRFEEFHCETLQIPAATSDTLSTFINTTEAQQLYYVP